MDPSIRPIHKLLIANRGEIAVRIMRTCRDMGIATVAVFSDADADALHVREADEAVHIGGAPAAESYLRVEAVVEAARRTGADALHPGFGFLSERPELAEACADAGIIFVGPSPEAIRCMGLKREAKEIATRADVPVVPGYDGADQDDAVIAREARAMGFPVLLKASAGGGGKGMRIVAKGEDLETAIEGARREAQSAFGDGTLLVEKYIERPRHVEIQILGDGQGNLVHLFERECSIQRRHQKVIEESPSPAVDEALRARMGRAAVSLGEAIGYTGAGTVEFLLGPDGSFYFLEVNTRLQVEHPVTECVTGLDLVREQIRIASGEALGYGQQDLRQQGAAVECRIYAEDPARGFLPGSGTVVDWHVPDLPGLRVDSGIESGSEVSIHYDPMLAKLITRGRDREEATRRMVRALELLSVQGLVTNRAFLRDTLLHPAYRAGQLHTHFIDDQLQAALVSTPSDGVLRRAATAATLHGLLARRSDSLLPGLPSGFRNNAWREQRARFALGERGVEVSYRDQGGGRYLIGSGDQRQQVRVISSQGSRLQLEEDGLRTHYRVVQDGAQCHVQAGSDGAFAGQSITLTLQPRFPDLSAALPPGGCVAPMPGKIVALDVAVGQRVEAGQRLLVMEAMKMEHSVTAPEAGEVVQLPVAVGAQVDADSLLAVVRPCE